MAYKGVFEESVCLSNITQMGRDVLDIQVNEIGEAVNSEGGLTRFITTTLPL